MLLWWCPYRYPRYVKLTELVKPLWGRPLTYSFMILPICVSPNRSQHLSLCYLQLWLLFPVHTSSLLSPPFSIPFLSFLLILIGHTPYLALFSTRSSPLFGSFLHSPLLCTVDPKYLKSSTVFICTPCNLQVQLGPLSFTDTYVFLARKPCPFLLHLSRFSSTCFLLSLQNTVSSANIRGHGRSCCASSLTVVNGRGLRADPQHCLTCTLNTSVTPAAHLANVLWIFIENMISSLLNQTAAPTPNEWISGSESEAG